MFFSDPAVIPDRRWTISEGLPHNPQNPDYMRLLLDRDTHVILAFGELTPVLEFVLPWRFSCVMIPLSAERSFRVILWPVGHEFQLMEAEKRTIIEGRYSYERN